MRRMAALPSLTNIRISVKPNVNGEYRAGLKGCNFNRKRKKRKGYNDENRT